MALQSTTPTNTQRAAVNRRNLLAVLGVTAIAVGLAVSYNVPWVDTAPAPLEAQQPEAGGIAVGDNLTFDSDHGKVSLTVASIDGEAVTVTDSDGDKMVTTMAQLSSKALPFGDVDAEAAKMMRVIDERVAAGYYGK